MNRVRTCTLTWRLHFGNKSTAKTERIRGSLWSRPRVTEISILILYLEILLPSKTRAEKWKWLPGSSRRFQQRVAMALSLSSIKGGYNSVHELQLRTVWSEWKFHLDATNPVHILLKPISSVGLGFRLPPPFCIDHFGSITQNFSSGVIRTHFELPSLGNYTIDSGVVCSVRFDGGGFLKSFGGKGEGLSYLKLAVDSIISSSCNERWGSCLKRLFCPLWPTAVKVTV